jgi:ArsR family transcriptional regulator, arsenate/arsenite/antimonite-responsive transcriptional repressor
MDESVAIEGLTALAQPTRLRVFRQLVRAHPEPVAAGEIARLVEVPHNTMSTHLAVLTRAGLLSVMRDGRAMLYRADLEGFRALVGFLTRDCCDGRPEICAPVLELLSTDCACEPERLHG